MYCYQTPEGVPPGVEIRDAAEVLPESSIIRHQSGSVSLFSNRFRYELQRRGLGTWLDCDAYLLAPLDGARDYLFGEYEPSKLNPGILRLPPDSPMLPVLLEPFEQRTIPSWLPWRSRAAARWRLLTQGRSDLSKMPWGYLGPHALTHAAKLYGMLDRALPRDVFYPVAWQDAGWLTDPRIALDDVITPDTVSIHLWNERIKHFKEMPAPPGSFLARLQEEGREQE